MLQFKFDWVWHALAPWVGSPWGLVVCGAVTVAAISWFSSQGRRQAFWAWLTDEHFYRHFGFLGLLWPQQQRKQVWPPVIEDVKAEYLERLEQARQYRGGSLPRWWVILANARFLLQMAFLTIEMSRVIAVATLKAVVSRKRGRSRRLAG
jgi:hypothetical protein